MAAMAEEEPPVTRDEVRGWFDDLEFTKDTSFNTILDEAQQQYRCEFLPGMSAEVKSIHDWLYEKYNEKQRRKARAHKDTFTIIQFNQQQLSTTHKDSEKRIQNLATTIWDIGNKSGFAACVMEEILVGGGEEAVKQIVAILNTKGFGDVYRFKCSGVVNPVEGGTREKYAIIWNERLLGPLLDDEENGYRLLTNGIEQLKRRIATEDEKHEQVDTDKIGSATIDLSRGREVWNAIGAVGGGINTVFPQFERMPALFSFHPPAFEKPIHIMAAHSATLNDKDKQNQNIAESILLQEICIQASSKGEYVVLLGDFNVDETGTTRLWDADIPLLEQDDNIGHALDENKLFGAIKDEFLSLYYRAVDPSLPTNVYPFLSGYNANPNHNDDIWLPKIKTPVYMRKPSGNRRPGKVHRIPLYVLDQWDKASDQYFINIGQSNGKFSRRNLNNLLSKVWSDHRPISATLTLPPPSKQKGKKGNTKAASEEVEELSMDSLSLEDPSDPIDLTLTRISPCKISDYTLLHKYFQEEEIALIRDMEIKEHLYYEVSHSTMLKTIRMDGTESAEELWDALLDRDLDPVKELKIFFDDTNPKAAELVRSGGVTQGCGKIGCACDTSFMRRIEEFIEVGATESLTKLMA